MNKNNNINLHRTYNLYSRGKNYNINIESENTFTESIGDTQNNEKMFNIFNDIEKNIKEVSENIIETNKIQKMYALKNIENANRIKKNHMNHFKTTAEYYSNNNNLSPNEKYFKYNAPSRIYKPNFDISNNFPAFPANYMPNNNQFNTENIFRSGEFNKINNYYNKEENDKSSEGLNGKNNNLIKKGFIRRAKSTNNSNHDKNKDNMDLSNNSNTFSENRKKIFYSNKMMNKLLEDIKAFKLGNQNLLNKNKSLIQKLNDYQKEIKEKDLRIKNLEKIVKNEFNNNEDKNIDNNVKDNKDEINNQNNKSINKENNKIDNNDYNDINRYSHLTFNLGDNISVYKKSLAYFENEYDKLFKDNIKLKEEIEKLKKELDDREEEKNKYDQLVEELKKTNKENYSLKSQNMSLNKDNLLMIQKIKKLEGENDLIKNEDQKMAIKYEKMSNDNGKIEKEFGDIIEKLKKKENENVKLNLNLESAEREINGLNKEIEELKLICIKCENLEKQNEKLILTKKQNEVEIKDLNNIIRKLEEKQFQDEDEEENHAEENNNNEKNKNYEELLKKELDEKNRIIEDMKDEKEVFTLKYNAAKQKLTEMEAIIETQKALRKKFQEQKKDVQKLQKLQEDNKNLREQCKKYEKQIIQLEKEKKELENKKIKKKKKNDE